MRNLRCKDCFATLKETTKEIDINASENQQKTLTNQVTLNLIYRWGVASSTKKLFEVLDAIKPEILSLLTTNGYYLDEKWQKDQLNIK